MVITPISYFWRVISLESHRRVPVSCSWLKNAIEELNSIISKFCVFYCHCTSNEAHSEVLRAAALEFYLVFCLVVCSLVQFIQL
jgi:hypothetical protein